MSTFVQKNPKIFIKKNVLNQLRFSKLALGSIYGFHFVDKGVSNRLINSDVIPPGMIWPFASATIHDRWLPTDGSFYNRLSYSRLFSKLGTLWGIGDTSGIVTNLSPATATASSADSPANNIFDGNAGTFWSSGNGFPQWVKGNLGSPTLIRTYKLILPFDGPKSWVLEGSNDDSNWTPIDTRQNVISHYWVGGTSPMWFEIQNPDSFQYYRLTVTATNGALDVNIYEWEMYGDISSSFHVPNAQRRALFCDGGDFTPGQAIGEENNVLGITHLPDHSHTHTWSGQGTATNHWHDYNYLWVQGNVQNPGIGYGNQSSFVDSRGVSGAATVVTGDAGSGDAHNNIQQSLVVNFLVRY